MKARRAGRSSRGPGFELELRFAREVQAAPLPVRREALAWLRRWRWARRWDSDNWPARVFWVMDEVGGWRRL